MAHRDTVSKTTADTSKKVAEYLEPLIEYARKFLPQERIKDIPLLLLATGGMRRLKQQHPQEFAILRTAIVDFIKDSGFRNPEYHTISGDDEGLYGWVAVNYVDGTFRADAEGPHGFVEMGGESAQFAVSIEEEHYADYSGILREVKIAGKVYKVFVKTWLGLGGESAWKRHEERLRESDSVMPHDPCIPKGYAYRLSGSDKTVLGTGDFVECMKETISLLNCTNKNCLAGNLCIYTGDHVGCLLQDPLSGTPLMKFDTRKFHGASVYWHATHGIFNAGQDGNDFASFWRQAVNLSTKNWEKMKAERPGEKQNGYKFLLKSFFTAAMVMSTLFVGFGIPMPQEALKATRDFAVERATWAIDAAEGAVRDAEKKSGAATAAMMRAVDEVAKAEKDEKEAKEEKEAMDKKKLNAEQAAQAKREALEAQEDEIACRSLYQSRPNQANWQDMMDTMKVANGTDDGMMRVWGIARAARERKTDAANKMMEAHAKLLEAKENRRQTKDMKTETLTVVPESKYSGSQNADWTLGRIVLLANNNKTDILSKRGWGP